MRDQAVIFILAFVAVGAFYSWKYFGDLIVRPTAVQTTVVSSSSPTPSVNPVEDIPQTNPFAENTNPISTIYKNPFAK